MAKNKHRVLSKKEFVIKQISRTNKKNYENYVITRIFHLLDDLDIKFVTQQFFKREDGSFGLSDLYFPQFNLSIEIDEGQHENSIKHDTVRDQDYVLATQDLLQHTKEWMPKRVKVYGDISLKKIDKEAANIISYIKSLKQKTLKDGSFVKWDIDKEFDYSDKKIFDVNDNIVFRTIVDGINYFRTDANKYHGYQRAGAKTMDREKLLWFPKLYPNKDWNNSISNDESLIKEISKKTSDLKVILQKSHFDSILESKHKKHRIVFARVKGNLGFVLYRFKGYFVLNEKMSRKNGYCCYERIATKVLIPSGDPVY
jgi:very-short-patch-repair endonuclease